MTSHSNAVPAADHAQRGGGGGGARPSVFMSSHFSHPENKAGSRRARRDVSDYITIMDNETVAKLIEFVRGYVFLYDLGHHQYKNASLKSTVWESIGKELNQTDEAVRSKWKTIRDGYTKYKKQLKTTIGNKTNVTYTWAPQLSFLDHFNVARPSYSKGYIDATQPGQDSDQSQDTLPSSPLPSTQVPSSTQNSTSHNKRRSSDHRRDVQFLKIKKRKELDVIDNLFLSYADTFKKFPAREQAIVKLELAKLFSNTELQLLNDDTNESNFYETTLCKVKREVAEDSP